jgi:Ca-activated chloride channel family protein
MNVLRALLVLASVSLYGQENPIFRTESRLVEVYATVRDHDGRYVDGLTREKFQVSDNGVVQPLVAFESNSMRLSCAILLDTTGSMADALPTVKNSVLRMINELRADDNVAVYSFNTGLYRLVDFTTDKAAAKQAVLRTRAAGSTALFDAISEVARDITRWTGKKAIVVFTDGDDNASLLNARAAVRRAKTAGVPVYAIAEGEALKSKALLTELKDIAEMTGAQFYQAKKAKEIDPIFQEISADLQHTYMLAYKAPPAEDQRWRTIAVTVNGLKAPKLRAKEGYFP